MSGQSEFDENEPHVIDLRESAGEIDLTKKSSRDPKELRVPADKGLVTRTSSLVPTADGGSLFSDLALVACDDETVDELQNAGAPDWLLRRARQSAAQSDLATVGAPEWLRERAVIELSDEQVTTVG